MVCFLSLQFWDKVKFFIPLFTGGGFVGGSGGPEFSGPDFLLQKNVVLVSMNYRLGVFGFLSLEDESLGVPGNAGLKDQTFALKWVKNNIRNFGGDPDNITLFGVSAGGASVHYHLISELSKGLFHRAIPQSGVAFDKTWALHKKRGIPERLAKKAGWDGLGGEKGLLEFLESADHMKIAEASLNLLSDEELYEQNLLFGFGPMIEPYITENCFLPKDPVLMAREAWGNDIDVIFSGGANEGLVLMFLDNRVGYDIEKYTTKFHQALPTELGIPFDSEKAKEYGEAVKKLYYGSAQPSADNWFPYSYVRFFGI
jgi:carboxylesterase type B